MLPISKKPVRVCNACYKILLSSSTSMMKDKKGKENPMPISAVDQDADSSFDSDSDDGDEDPSWNSAPQFYGNQ